MRPTRTGLRATCTATHSPFPHATGARTPLRLRAPPPADSASAGASSWEALLHQQVLLAAGLEAHRMSSAFEPAREEPSTKSDVLDVLGGYYDPAPQPHIRGRDLQQMSPWCSQDPGALEAVRKLELQHEAEARGDAQQIGGEKSER